LSLDITHSFFIKLNLIPISVGVYTEMDANHTGLQKEKEKKDHEKKGNEVPLCHKCKNAHAWSGICVNCYMANHSKPLFVRGDWRMPDTHNIRKGYYMEEEHYARAHRAERERRDGFS
jgi:hypothetical protein